MNNSYNFIPNTSFIRSVPPVNPGYIAPIPRISSLFGRTAATGGAASKITFSGILNGASKTLGVINQAIPVFYQVKPIWNNARTMFRVVKGLNQNDNNVKTSTSGNSSNTINNTEKQKQSKNSNAPVFFR